MTAADRIRTTELCEHAGECVTLAGWLHALRRLGGISFLVLRDGWGLAQVAIENESALRPLVEAGALPESVIRVSGLAVQAPQAPGGVELRDPQLELLTPVTEPAPVILGKRELKASLPALLEHAPVANRHLARRAVFRLASAAMTCYRAALLARGFTEIQTPKIVASATESGANVFAIDYLGRPAYLAQSPQFYKQMMVGVFERVFEVGAVFRAEPHDTTRHLNEYVSLDAEMGFIESHLTVMAVLRGVLDEMLRGIGEACGNELALLKASMPAVPGEIPCIHFAEAQDLLLRFGVDVRGEPDLAPQDERLLGDWARAEHGSDFLFVTGYPMRKRPFYTHPDPARPEFSNSFDLLFRGTELVTGGQRLHRYTDYLDALARANLPVGPFAAYLETFRFGMPPHGGFAIGLERPRCQEQVLHGRPDRAAGAQPGEEAAAAAGAEIQAGEDQHRHPVQMGCLPRDGFADRFLTLSVLVR
jgi:nondiscriminating aspartyl-tRNA synthetase